MPTPSNEVYREIPLSRGMVALVDPSDYEWLMQWKWYVGNQRNALYARRNPGIFMHRLIMGLQKGDRAVVDHVNRNTLDNRRSNLRVCTDRQNRWNTGRRRNNATGFKGVWQVKPSTWRASIKHNGKTFHLGTFRSPEAAHDAWCAAALKVRGRFSGDPPSLSPQ